MIDLEKEKITLYKYWEADNGESHYKDGIEHIYNLFGEYKEIEDGSQKYIDDFEKFILFIMESSYFGQWISSFSWDEEDLFYMQLKKIEKLFQETILYYESFTENEKYLQLIKLIIKKDICYNLSDSDDDFCTKVMINILYAYTLSIKRLYELDSIKYYKLYSETLSLLKFKEEYFEEINEQEKITYFKNDVRNIKKTEVILKKELYINDSIKNFDSYENSLFSVIREERFDHKTKLVYCKELLQLFENGKKFDSQYFSNLSRIQDLCHNLGLFTDQFTYAKKSIDLMDQLNTYKKDEDVYYMHSLASIISIYKREKDESKIINFYKDELIKYRKLYKKEPLLVTVRYTHILSELLIFLDSDKEKILKEILKSYKYKYETIKENERDYYNSIDNLSNYYIKEKQYTKAEKVLNEYLKFEIADTNFFPTEFEIFFVNYYFVCKELGLENKIKELISFKIRIEEKKKRYNDDQLFQGEYWYEINIQEKRRQNYLYKNSTQSKDSNIEKKKQEIFKEFFLKDENEEK